MIIGTKFANRNTTTEITFKKIKFIYFPLGNRAQRVNLNGETRIQ